MGCKHYDHNFADTKSLSFLSRLVILIITESNGKIMTKKRRRQSCKMWKMISTERERLGLVWRRKPTLFHFGGRMRWHFSKRDEASLLMFRNEFPFDSKIVVSSAVFSVKVDKYFRFSVAFFFFFLNFAFNSLIVSTWSDIYAFSVILFISFQFH